MAKIKVKFCYNCKCDRECIDLGKEKMTSEEIRDKIEDAIFTCGIFTILGWLCQTDSRPRFFKCTKCGKIFKE